MVQWRFASVGQLGACPPCPGPKLADSRMPRALRGTEQKSQGGPPCVKGAGTGWSLIQNSGQASWLPNVSLLTAKATGPGRPAKSNGCLGYSASVVTLLPSLLLSRSWPLQTRRSVPSGCAGRLAPQASMVEGSQVFAIPWPKLVAPVTREAPHSVPFNWPERLVTAEGWSNVSQNAAAPWVSCMPQAAATAADSLREAWPPAPPLSQAAANSASGRRRMTGVRLNISFRPFSPVLAPEGSEA